MLLIKRIFLIAWLCSSAIYASVDTFIPSYEAVTCPETLVVPSGQKIECGYLTAPQSRTHFNGSTIKIFVVTILSNASNPESNPVVMLGGGPGQAASSYLGAVWVKGENLLQNRNIILVDQRGSGLSQPSLKCAPAQGIFSNVDASIEEIVQAFRQCYEDYIKEGVQLDSYNTTENAADLRDLRKALGIQQWNLLGTSYGTRLALEAMRQDPDGIRSVVLNSAEPTSASQFGSEIWYQNLERVFKLMFADCKADKNCNKAFPNLETRLKELETWMNKDPIELPYTDPITFKKKKSKQGYAALIYGLFSKLTFAPTKIDVPFFITAIYEYYTKQKPLTLPQEEAIFHEEEGGTALGMYISTLCHEDYPFINFSNLKNVVKKYLPYTLGQNIQIDTSQVCSFWGAGKASKQFKEPVTSNIPTLLLSGDYDMLSPPVHSEEIAKTLPNSKVLSFRGIGHDVYDTNICSHAIVASFINNPTEALAGKLEDKCLSYMKQPTFLVPKDYLNPSKREGLKPQKNSILVEKKKLIEKS